MLEVVSQITLATLSVALVVAFIRLVKGPTLPDRIVAMDLFGVLVVGLIVVAARRSHRHRPIGFLGTIAYATYVERGIRNDRHRDRDRVAGRVGVARCRQRRGSAYAGGVHANAGVDQGVHVRPG